MSACVLMLAFLGYNALFWLPWGFVNVVWPESWSGQLIPHLDVYDVSKAVTRNEVRAMYGGLQMAMGGFALFALLRSSYREPAAAFFVFGLTGIAAGRLFGLMVENENHYFWLSSQILPGLYNQVVRTSYELPNMLLGYAALFASWRSAP